MSILPVHQRLAELYLHSTKRMLSDSEKEEMAQCLSFNAKHCWKVAELENLSYMASLTKDTEWLHCLCAALEQLEYRVTKQTSDDSSREEE